MRNDNGPGLAEGRPIVIGSPLSPVPTALALPAFNSFDGSPNRHHQAVTHTG